ncbi:hypothetical protein [Kordiimonas sp. SCSIO 12610]|uniref:hypothetical protein n=1 Tax=Kordiimonas sp. SCSIO 12610 TaxID=2829597 RepID=UPI00210CB097|nr:hypothetical protein [Kordiimonas sp. SCSIO 12610]UTW56109.1 hypothetical protein KFF44_04225 [Kordiimonas sp. SCSIO 12610]
MEKLRGKCQLMTNNRISEFVRSRFPQADWLHDYFKKIFNDFAASGCADNEFISELIKGDDTFVSRAWEAVLYGLLLREGFEINGLRAGPDFQLQRADEPTVLVEATTPSPDGLPPEWINPETDYCRSMPHEAMLLKWTSSFATKAKKHLADIEKGYAKKDQPFVIAINGRRLSNCGDDFGITDMPFAVESIFPVGPIEVPINRETLEFGEPRQSWRSSVRKPSTDTNIPTDNFLNSDYAHVSALIGCSRLWVNDYRETCFPHLYLVHNPLAENPLPKDWLDCAQEYVATIVDDTIEISRAA